MTTAERHCDHCGALIASTSRPDRRFCSPGCRVAFHQEKQRVEHSAAGSTPVREAGFPPELVEALERAVSEERLVAQIAAASRTNWRAAAWILERRYPERWGRPRRPAEDEEPLPVAEADDPFTEVDEIATRRRRRELGPSA